MVTGSEDQRHASPGHKRLEWISYPIIRYPLMGGVIAAVTFTIHLLTDIPSWVTIPPYIVSMLLGGYHWGWEAFEVLIEERRVNIGILMLFALIGSAAVGLWEEAAFLAVLYGAAEGVEEATYTRTRESIRDLLDLVPRTATVLDGGREREVPAEELHVGDIVVILPGEYLVSDGIIVNGRTSINESPVTGESIPVQKGEGQEVFAGTVNQEGSIEVRVTREFEDNTISRIIHLVEEAQEVKGRSQQFIERFGRVYTPLILLIAGLLVVFPFMLGWEIDDWVERSVIFLVASAPCALVMSTPVAIAAGIGRSGRSGVLIKGGVHLENLGKVSCVAFDKTGTITTGYPMVTDVVPISREEREVLQLAASAERRSQHPLARALLERARLDKVELLEGSDHVSLIGFGVRASIGSDEIYVGQPSIFNEMETPLPDPQILDSLEREGKAAVLVGTAKNVLGIIAFRDEPRTDCRSAVEELNVLGIRTVMLTGDNRIAASSIADMVGIDVVRAELTPEQKIEAIRELKEECGIVAMVGDGINDAPALAESSVGIAMGAAGTDAAIQASDVALMSDDISRVPYAVRMGRRARIIGRQNIAFSIIVLAILIPSALLGVLSVATAVIFHEASELIAVANGVRAGRDP
ncbi:MAG: cation-translocating P-type ATPase [Methanomassiliicoccales archaeon]|nr:cation-translocating P-type ATPase [Methanomassiliicoccales archaeon]NYT14518.1 cation-translocating P-type ATPase [Methanomassiliicoccales archaeon]